MSLLKQGFAAIVRPVKTAAMNRIVAVIGLGLICGVGAGCDSGKATTTAGAKPYPLGVCPVSGEKLGGMGDAYVFVHSGQEVKLCCKGCLKTFNKEPATYMKKIADAQKKK